MKCESDIHQSLKYQQNISKLMRHKQSWSFMYLLNIKHTESESYLCAVVYFQLLSSHQQTVTSLTWKWCSCWEPSTSWCVTRAAIWPISRSKVPNHSWGLVCSLSVFIIIFYKFFCPFRYQRLVADAGTTDSYIGPSTRFHCSQCWSQKHSQEGQSFALLRYYCVRSDRDKLQSETE